MILYENSIENFIKSVKERKLVNYLIDEYMERFSRKNHRKQKNSMEICNGSVEEYSY